MKFSFKSSMYSNDIFELSLCKAMQLELSQYIYEKGRMFATTILIAPQQKSNLYSAAHMRENMFLGVKLICPGVVACVSSGNRIRMLWTNAQSLVHSFCRSGGIRGVGGAIVLPFLPPDFDKN